MSRTIMELFHSSGLKESVKADKETFIEQEISGIRIKSLVELNNPLIYGNEATRIALRSTPDLEKMKKGTGGTDGDGGLIGGKISGARNFVNDELGIPKGLIPSEVVTKIIDSDPTNDKVGSINNSQIPITKDLYGPNGKDVGKFLKQSGGGNPTTIGKQALGKGIGLLKDEARKGLFGGPQSIGEAAGDDNAEKIKEYSNVNPYTKILKDVRDYKNEGGYQEFKDYENESPIKFANASDSQVDLRKVSPAYAVSRGGLMRFGNTEYAFEPKTIKESKKLKTQYSSETPYATRYNSEGKGELVKGSKAEESLGELYGLNNLGDNINTISVADDYSLDENDAFIKVGTDTYKDLIPLWFRRKGGTKPIAFRAIISGLTESSTPSWSGQKFLGNPYSFYLYEGVERSISFNLKVAAASPIELANIWERLKVLTTYTYPTIKNGLSNPPIIEFRLGSMYNNRTSFIETLQYTIPDEGNWETDGEVVGYLPKIVDISMTLKFIEQEGAEQRVYDFNLSKAAVDKINQQREVNFSTKEQLNSNGTYNRAKPMKVTIKKQASGLGISDTKPTVLKSVNPNVPSQTPPSSDRATEDIKTESAQSSASTTLSNKTPIQATKEQEKKSNMNPFQSKTFTSLKVRRGAKVKVESIPKNKLPYYAKQESLDNPGSIYVKSEGPHSIKGGNVYVFEEISPSGTRHLLMNGTGTIPTDPTPRELAMERALTNSTRGRNGGTVAN